MGGGFCTAMPICSEESRLAVTPDNSVAHPPAGSPSPLRIRAAGLADAGIVATCVANSFTHYVERMGKPPQPMLRNYNDVITDHPVYLTFVDEKLAGVLVLGQGVDGFSLDIVAVDPRFQGRGMGKQLVLFAEARARACGFDSIHLFTNAVMVENQAFYSRLGYTQYARRNEEAYDRVFFRNPLA